MSTDETTPDPSPKPSKHTMTLTRGALYLLAGIMKLSGPLEGSVNKIVLWNRIWGKLRAVNSRMIPVPWEPKVGDYEKGFTRPEAMTEVQWSQLNRDWLEKQQGWENETITVALSDKFRDPCREAVRWVLSHRDDPKVPYQLVGEHAASLVVALGLPTEKLVVDDDDLVVV